MINFSQGKTYLRMKALQIETLWNPPPWDQGAFLSRIFSYSYIGISLPLFGCHLVVVWLWGEDFGIPFLFWHDSPRHAFFSGLTTALFSSLGVFLFFLLDYSRRIKELSLCSEADFANLFRSRSHWSDRLFRWYVKSTEGEGVENYRMVLNDYAKSLKVQAFLFRSANIALASFFFFIFLLRVVINVFYSTYEGVNFFPLFFHGRPASFVTLIAPILGFVTGIILVSMIQHCRVALLRQVNSGRSGLYGNKWGSKSLIIHACFIFFWLLVFYLSLWVIEIKGDYYFSWGALASLLGWIMFFSTVGIFLFRELNSILRFLFFGIFIVIGTLLFQSNYGYEGFDDKEFPGAVPLVRDEVESASFVGEGLDIKDLSWRKSFMARGSSQSEQPLVIVCASGGGIAAEVFSIQMLDHLSRKVPRFQESVRIITGASGGMVGAASWAGDFRILQPSKENDSEIDAVPLSERCTTDQLSPLVHRMCLWDFSLPGMIGAQYPFGRNTDRGNKLEQIWIGGSSHTKSTNPITLSLKKTPLSGPILPELQYTLGRRKQHEKDGQLPSMIFSPTIAEDGRALLVSNLDVGKIANAATDEVSFYQTLSSYKRHDLVRSAVDARQLFGSEFVDSVPLSTWARMSATFPIVTPAAAIECDFSNNIDWASGEKEIPTKIKGSIHPIDAGYVDNFGTSIALKWLEEYWLPAMIEAPDSVPSSVILIELDAFSRYGKEGGWLIEGKSPLEQTLEKAFKDLVIPLKGASNRMKSVVYRTDQHLESFENQIEFLGSRNVWQGVQPYFKSFRFVSPVESSLSWRLSAIEKQQLLKLTESIELTKHGLPTNVTYKNDKMIEDLKSETDEFIDYWGRQVLLE